MDAQDPDPPVGQVELGKGVPHSKRVPPPVRQGHAGQDRDRSTRAADRHRGPRSLRQPCDDPRVGRLLEHGDVGIERP